jgi:hypothetical protein
VSGLVSCLVRSTSLLFASYLRRLNWVSGITAPVLTFWYSAHDESLLYLVARHHPCVCLYLAAQLRTSQVSQAGAPLLLLEAALVVQCLCPPGRSVGTCSMHACCSCRKTRLPSSGGLHFIYFLLPFFQVATPLVPAFSAKCLLIDGGSATARCSLVLVYPGNLHALHPVARGDPPRLTKGASRGRPSSGILLLFLPCCLRGPSGTSGWLASPVCRLSSWTILHVCALSSEYASFVCVRATLL